MAGLLDFLNSDEARMGIGLLSAAGPQTDIEKTGLGYALAQGAAASDAYKRQQMANLLTQSQAAENYGQAQERALKGRQSILQQQALANPFNADGTVNAQGLLAAGVKPDDIEKIAQFNNLGRNKVARTIEVQGPDGVYTVQVDDYGQAVGQPVRKFVAPMEVGQGDRKTLINSVTGAPITSFAVNVSPDAALGAQVTQRGQDSLANTAVWKEQFQADLKKATEGGKLTEDQSKATQMLSEALNEFNTIKQTALDKNGNLTDAARWGASQRVGATIGALPFADAAGKTVTNVLMSPEKQRYTNAANNLSDLFLRSMTGAGMNKDEAERQVKKMLPQEGDDDVLIKQKLDRLPIQIESLRARAGPGAALADKAIANAQPVVNLPGKKADAGPQVQSKFVNVNGTQMMARRGDDGRYWVQVPGGWAPVKE